MSSRSRLTFLKHSHNKVYIDKNGYKNTTVYNVYKCECGNVHTASRSHVKTLQVKSCGCLKKESDRKMGLAYKGNLKPMKKGDKKRGNSGAKKGTPAYNKGMVLIKDYPNKRWSTGHYVKPEVADAMFYGLEGEVHSLRQRSKAHNKGKKFKDGKYVA